LEFLKADYTEVWISAAVVPLVQFADCVRAISATQLDLVGVGLEFPPGLAQRLREFDEVISWYGSNRAEFRSEMTAVHPRCTFLQALPDDSWHEYAADFFLRQVGGPLGLSPSIGGAAATERRHSVLIQPFSGSASKNWPLENYRELAERLPIPVEWIAGPEETLAGATRFENLLDLAHWMRGAAIYLGNDSGIAHLAAAIGLPGVILFGPTNPVVWGPRSEKIRILHHQPLNELPVETVLQALTVAD